jgi:hypothetical protein
MLPLLASSAGWLFWLAGFVVSAGWQADRQATLAAWL